jgi:hypothetical protein
MMGWMCQAVGSFCVGLRSNWWPLLVLSGVFLGAARLNAAETEARAYSVLIDGRPAGAYHSSISTEKDGTVTMIGKADIKVSFLIFSYKYSYQGTEVWKDGRLQRFSSSCDDDGKRYTVSAAAENGVMKVKVNGEEHTASADVWVTSYWRLPDAKFCNHELPLLDGDTGKNIAAKLQQIGNEKVAVAGREVPCTHHRLTGGVQIDLWYDGQDRLVREEFVEDGHRTVLQLTSVGNK